VVAGTAWRAATPVASGLFRWWFDLETVGHSPPPAPVVIAANHYSHLDPVIVSLAMRRPMRFLAVDELFGRSRVFDALTLWLRTIPMTRTRIPFGPLKTALAELAGGGTVGLFPEGVRVWHWGEREAKRGAAWLALRAGVPLVPIAISGSDVAMGRGTNRIIRAPLRVEICEPIAPGDVVDSDDPVGAMTSEWVDRLDGALRPR
jgi:1-acyl-sn-glycerol-3-phosphate acyltransferase